MRTGPLSRDLSRTWKRVGSGLGGREVPGGLESGLNWEMEVRECQERARLAE